MNKNQGTLPSKITLAFIILLAIIIGGLLSGLIIDSTKPTGDYVTIEDVFMDIDGDGDIDYVKSMTVITNSKNLEEGP